MPIDAYIKNLISGLIFHDSKPKLLKLIGIGGWGNVYLIVFENGMELTIKTCSLYYKNYHEIQNIKRLSREKQSPYVCYYYGYTTIENNKYVFVSKNSNLKFIGKLEKVPDEVLNNKIIPKSTFSYFNIIMEKLENIDTKKIFDYSHMNTIYFVSFLIGCLKGLRDISKNKIVHGDIHKISNIGFIKINDNYYAPKLLDFGSIKTSNKAFIDKSSNWKLKTFKKEGYYKWSPEMLGCVYNNTLDKSKYKNNYCNIKNAFATQNSDIFMFFKGIVFVEIIKISDIDISYLDKNDVVYNKLYKLLITKIRNNASANKKIFNNQESENLFVEKLTRIMLDCIEPNYKIRPTANDIIIKLYKCLQIYMIQSEVDKIYQPFQKAYIDSLNNK